MTGTVYAALVKEQPSSQDSLHMLNLADCNLIEDDLPMLASILQLLDARGGKRANKSLTTKKCG